MKIRTLFCSLMCVLALCLSIAGCSSHSNEGAADNIGTDGIPPELQAEADKLVAYLRGLGYEVAVGNFVRADKEDGWNYLVPKYGTCSFNNVETPYPVPSVPFLSGEFIDPGTQESFSKQTDPNKFNTVHRFDPKGALILFGMMPPEGKYMSFQTYLYTKQGSIDKSSDTYKALQGTPWEYTFFRPLLQSPGRMLVFSALGDPINHVDIQDSYGAFWEQKMAIITTPDRGMDQAIRDAFKKLGINLGIFTEPIPGTLKIGLDKEASDFVHFVRYAKALDGGAPGTPSYNWRQNVPIIPIIVRDKNNRLALPYGPHYFGSLTINLDERPFAPELNSLVQRVQEKWGTAYPISTMQTMELSPLSFGSPINADIGMSNIGPTSDTSYALSPMYLDKLDEGGVYAIVGLNSVALGNATYQNFNLYDSIGDGGFDYLNDQTLAGTASGFFPAGDPSASKFLVYYIARDCSKVPASLTGDNCRSVSEYYIPPCNPGDSICYYLQVMQRRYLLPGSNRGPDPTRLLESKLLRVQ